jgi:hypothetical protein
VVELLSDNSHFLVSARINALFVGKQVQNYNIAWFKSSYLLGENYPTNVVDFNLGINSTMFGKPYIGYRCIIYMKSVQPKLVGFRNNIITLMTGDDITAVTSF